MAERADYVPSHFYKNAVGMVDDLVAVHHSRYLLAADRAHADCVGAQLSNTGGLIMVTLSEKKLRALMNECYLIGFNSSTYTDNGGSFRLLNKNPERWPFWRKERDELLAKVKLA